MIQSAATFSPGKASGFIVLEGVNGAGKTTLQARVCEFLRGRHKVVVSTREPGSTTLGKSLRSLVLEREGEAPCDMAELFLFAADRAQHVDRIIKPALAAGSWVVSDRYYYSTMAFQGYGRGISRDTIAKVNSLAISGVLPDVVLLLDLDPHAGLRRTQSRQGSASRSSDSFELEDLEFHCRIRAGFLEIAEQAQEPFVILDASQSPEQIFDQACRVLEPLLKISGEGRR